MSTGQESPGLVELGQQAQRGMREELFRDRMRSRITGALPTNRAAASQEMTEEQRALRQSRPRTRRWEALNKLDAEVERLQVRLAEQNQRVVEANVALELAPDRDAAILAGWLAEGERGPKPEPTAPELQRHRDAEALLVEAVTRELDRALEGRVRHVEKHRRRMLADLQKEQQAAKARLLAIVRQLEEVRFSLLAGREDALWLASYPAHPVAWPGSNPMLTAIGLRGPVQRALNTTGQVAHAAVVQLLEEDAEALVSAFSREQKKALGMEVDYRGPLDGAVWWDDPNDSDLAEWKREQLRLARERAEYGFVDPARLAEEIADERP